MGELQPLGVVDGHELHGVLAVLPIPVREEGHLREEVLQCAGLPGAGLILLQALQQLRDVVQPIPVPQLLEHLHIAALGQEVAEKLAHLHALVVLVGLQQGHEGRGVGGLDHGIVQVVQERPVQAAALLLGIAAQKGHALLAHPPPWLVHHPGEGKIVAQGQHPEVADGVLDLLAAIELHAAPDGIGDLRVQQGVLQTPGHVVGPVEDGHVPPVVPRFLQFLQAGDDELRLGPHVLGVVVGGHGPGRVHGVEAPLHPLLVLLDEGVGRSQNFRGAPVILRQDHGLGPGVLVGEVQNEMDVRPPPGVDGLVRVPHHEQVLMAGAEHVGQLILLAVDVLKFVHHHVLEPLRPLLPDLLVLPEQGHCHVHQVLKVQGVDLPLLVEVAIEHLAPPILLPVDELEKGPVALPGEERHVG